MSSSGWWAEAGDPAQTALVSSPSTKSISVTRCTMKRRIVLLQQGLWVSTLRWPRFAASSSSGWGRRAEIEVVLFAIEGRRSPRRQTRLLRLHSAVGDRRRGAAS
jgi:hypothetical protein